MSNKITLEKSTIRREPDIYVVASNAVASHKNNNDAYVCDGTNDEVQIQAAINELGTTGGSVQLSEGSFTLADVITVGEDFIRVTGMGDGATKVTQTSMSTPAFNLYNQDVCELSNLRVIMPTTTPGDGIQTGTGVTLKNVGIQGGATTNYLIRLTDSFNFNLENIKGHGAIGNGICFDYTGELYYGNGSVRNVQFSMKANTKAINIGARYNLSTFDTINIVTGQGTGNGIYGFYIDGAFNNTFNMLDLEGLDYSMHITSNAKGNHVTRLYTTARLVDILLDTGTKNNLFISSQTGSSPWLITDNGSRNLSERNRFINQAFFVYESEPPRFYDDFDGAVLNPMWATEGTVTLGSGLATITTAATNGENALINFGGNSGYKDLYETYMETKLKRVSTGNYDIYFGLNNGGWAETNQAAYFRALYDDTNWQCVVCKADAINVTDSGVAKDTTLHTFRMHKYNTGTATKFYIDDVMVASMHNSPTTTTLREPCFEVIARADAAKAMSVDYVILQQGRAPTP